MSETVQDAGVHAEPTREETTVVPIRLPVSLLKQVEAVQSKNRDRWRNTTLVKALEAYVNDRLRRAA